MTRTLSRFQIPHIEDPAIVEVLELERKANPAWADVLNRHGLLMMVREQWAAARSEFEGALKINPEYGWAKINLAACLWMEGRGREAWPLLDQVKRGPACAKEITQAWFYILGGQAAKAAFIVQHLSSVAHRRPDVLWIKTALAELESSETAARLWHQLVSDPIVGENPNTVALLKGTGRASEDWGLFPGLSELWMTCASIAARQGKPQAAALFNEIQHLFYSDRGRYWNQKALIATLSGNDQDAVEFYNRSMKTTSVDPTAPAALADYWLHQHDFDRARHYMQTALDRAPGHADLHRAMARIESARGHWAGALEACRKALSINPKYRTARLEEAYCLFHLGIWNESAEAFKRVIDHGLGSQDVFQHLGKCYENLGQPDLAEDCQKRASA